MNFTTRIPAKWILVGEHAVLRGAPALVFPLREKSLQLSYCEDSSVLQVHFSGDYGKEVSMIFWSAFEKALEVLGVFQKRAQAFARTDFKGTIHIQNDVPIGTGLGFSAVLCVAFARWLAYQKLLNEENIFDFAKRLEDFFHGESSGVDIAVAMANQPLHFYRGGPRETFNPLWQPCWYLSYTGQRAITSDCVNKVKSLIQKQPERGRQLDQKMREASLRAYEALLSPPSDKTTELLALSLHEAHQCFVEWGLAGGCVREHISWLQSKGARAVKPTGSGDGGYVLSLWDSQPPQEIRDDLISCN